ncbi:Transcriptional regulator [Fructobacillus cardui]|uniref:helix-turn-helix domain-containing protein n=1 Tax=Fructobacillus cardui TaxID=2893170 RepID=UPI002D9CC6F9|nr:Transcriptional regulator [Fructobacillus cardui]
MSKNRLKELRKEKGYTLNDIAQAIGIKRGTFNNYENGKTEPKLETWEKLAKFYGVTPAYLVGWED